MNPTHITLVLRITFILISITGLSLLYLEFRLNKKAWRTLWIAGSFLIELGTFYTLRMFGIPADPIAANWISSSIQFSGVIVIMLLTRLAVRK